MQETRFQALAALPGRRRKWNPSTCKHVFHQVTSQAKVRPREVEAHMKSLFHILASHTQGKMTVCFDKTLTDQWSCCQTDRASQRRHLGQGRWERAHGTLSVPCSRYKTACSEWANLSQLDFYFFFYLHLALTLNTPTFNAPLSTHFQVSMVLCMLAHVTLS